MKKIDYRELALGLIFLILPTIFIIYPLLGFLAEYYSLLFIDKHILIGVFAIGIITAYLLHKTKIRFLIIFGLLILVINFVYSSISSTPFSEFDAYYVANRFKINTFIFVFGWFSGFAISKWRYYLIFFSMLLMFTGSPVIIIFSAVVFGSGINIQSKIYKRIPVPIPKIKITQIRRIQMVSMPK